MYNKILSYKLKSIFLFVVFLGLLIIGTLMMNKISLQSDILYFQDFLSSYFQDPALFSTWRMTPAPAYFPELALFAVARLITQDFQIQIFFVSYLEWLLVVIGILSIYRVINRDALFASWILLLTALGATSIVIISSDIWFLTYQNTIHFAALLFPLYQLLILIKILKSPPAFKYQLLLFVMYGVLSFIGALSTPVYLLSWFIPSSIACVWLFSLFSGGNHRHKQIRISIALAAGIVGTGLGYFLQKELSFNTPLLNRVGFSQSEFEASVLAFINALFTSFNSTNIFTRIAIFSVIVSLLFLVMRVLSSGRLDGFTTKSIRSQITIAYKTDFGISILSFIAVMSFGSSLIGSIVTAGFKDIYGFRYVTFGAFILWFTVIFIVINWFEITTSRRKISEVSSWIAGGIVILLSFSIVTGSISPLGRLLDEKGLVNQFKDLKSDPLMFSEQETCIENLQNTGVSLQAGVAQYWQVRSIRYLSNKQITISPFDSSLVPFFWMNSTEDFDLNSHHFNWLLIEPENSSPFSMTAARFKESVPQTYEVFKCGGGYEIWYWEGNQFNDFISVKINEWIKADWITKN